MSDRPFEPRMTDDPDAFVHCIDGRYDGKEIKLCMLSNLSDGAYTKDPACTYTSPKSGVKYPCYRWIAKA